MAMFEQLSRTLEKGSEALDEAMTTLRLVREVLSTLPELVREVHALARTTHQTLGQLAPHLVAAVDRLPAVLEAQHALLTAQLERERKVG